MSNMKFPNICRAVSFATGLATVVLTILQAVESIAAISLLSISITTLAFAEFISN